MASRSSSVMSVVWPQPNVTLTERQTFKVALNHTYNPNDVMLRWSVENWKQSGEMSFDGTVFVADVNTDNWDWKRDNTYEVNFTTLDKYGNFMASSSVTVAAGASLLVNAEAATESAEAKGYIVPDSQTAAAVESSVATAAPTAPYRIEWVPGPVRSDQKFIFHTEGYVGRDLSAFWSVEGGHQNLVYKTADAMVFTTNINVFGWLWKGVGPYPITFSVTDKTSSAVIVSAVLELYWKGVPGASDIEFRSGGTVIVPPSTTPPVVLTSTPTVTPSVPVATASNPVVTSPLVTKSSPATTSPSLAIPLPVPITGKVSSITTLLGSTKLYLPTKPAVLNALATLTDSTQKTAVSYILAQPSTIWLNGDSYETDAYISGLVAKATSQNAVPSFVLYNIVQRDCNSYSSGGAKTMANYKTWINRLAGVFKNTSAILVVEPDALAMLNCVSGTARAERIEMIKYAVTTLTKTSPKVLVYVDAGHPFWVNAEEMATRLTSVNIAAARGFSLNVSSFASTEDNVTYGTYLSNLLGGKRYVIDSSRNGNGRAPNGEWCNPAGRALGQSGTLYPDTKGALDAVLWIKFPGESDGTCNGGPGAGQWWTAYATALYTNRK